MIETLLKWKEQDSAVRSFRIACDSDYIYIYIQVMPAKKLASKSVYKRVSRVITIVEVLTAKADILKLSVEAALRELDITN